MPPHPTRCRSGQLLAIRRSPRRGRTGSVRLLLIGSAHKLTGRFKHRARRSCDLHLAKLKYLQRLLQIKVLRFMLCSIYNSRGSRDMPKCEVDRVLQDRVNRFVRESGLTVCGAASELGVDRTTFWRFCDSGRARSDTRAQYREALEKRNNNPATSVAYDADALARRARAALQRGLVDHELKLIRTACEGVLMLLDVYEAQSLGKRS